MNAAFIRIAMLAVALGSMTLPVAAVPQQAGVQNQSPTGVPVDPKDPFGTKAQDDKDRSSMPTDMQHRLQEQRQTERQKRIGWCSSPISFTPMWPNPIRTFFLST
jgi:hypothetical protein